MSFKRNVTTRGVIFSEDGGLLEINSISTHRGYISFGVDCNERFSIPLTQNGIIKFINLLNHSLANGEETEIINEETGEEITVSFDSQEKQFSFYRKHLWLGNLKLENLEIFLNELKRVDKELKGV